MSEQSKQTNLLGRLLGPGESELSCEECFAQLDRYVELELSGADADAGVPGMRAHLQGCPACNEDHRSLRDLVATEAAVPAPPPASPEDE
ncbi:MAG TPA: hypothetical protein VE401_04730 [Solirubrobacterales bacterium]|nr:hypothetical protein [Solirubrobacterales bacterium]